MKGNWIHAYSMDVYYEILKSYDVHPDYKKIKYRCWCISQTGESPWLLSDGILKGKIYKKDLKNWRRYE